MTSNLGKSMVKHITKMEVNFYASNNVTIQNNKNCIPAQKKY